MPQGKMKVKAKGAPPAKKDKSKKTHGGIQKGGNNLKKGKFTIAPKKQVKLRKYFKGRSVHIISFPAPPGSIQVQARCQERNQRQKRGWTFKISQVLEGKTYFAIQVELKEKAQTFEAKDFNTLNSEAGASAN